MYVSPAIGTVDVAASDYDLELVEWPSLESAPMTPRQRDLFAYWCGPLRRGSAAALDAIDPLEVRSCVGYLHVLAFDDGRQDFFYRVYGTGAATAAKAEMHRHWVSENPGLAGPKLRLHYLALLVHGNPWVGRVNALYGGPDVERCWNRMVLPLRRSPLDHIHGFLTLAEPSGSVHGPAG